MCIFQINHLQFTSCINILNTEHSSIYFLNYYIVLSILAFYYLFLYNFRMHFETIGWKYDNSVRDLIFSCLYYFCLN